MTLTALLRPTENLPATIFRLALLNVAIAVFSALTFVGGIQAVAWINRLRRAGDPAAGELPFPYPVLFLLYAALLFAVWIWFAKILPPMDLRKRLAVAIGGASPLLALGLLGGVLHCLALLVSGGRGDDPAAATFHIVALISALVLAAGVCGVLTVLLAAPGATPPRSGGRG